MSNKNFKFYNFNEGKTVHYSIVIFGINVFGYYNFNRFTWLRLFGFGFYWKDTNIHRLRFSERIKAKKSLYLGNWYFKSLNR